MYNLNMLAHFRAIRDYSDLLKFSVDFNVADMRLKISGNGRQFEFRPSFIGYGNNSVSVYSLPPPGSFHFGGWFPGDIKRWPIAQDKIAFKEYCVQNEIRTPPRYRKHTEVDGDVLVKAAKAAQGLHVSGPYLQAAASRLPFDEDFIVEKFVRGRMLRAWFWDGAMACIDERPMPVLVGDGKSTAQELSSGRVPDGNPALKEIATNCLSCQGVSADDVLPSGRRAFVDYRYWSPLTGFPMARQNATNTLPLTVQEQLRQAGKSIWIGVPANVRPNSVYTLTAVLDDFGNVWVVDVEDTPLMHPDAYELMLSTLFGTPRVANLGPSAGKLVN